MHPEIVHLGDFTLRSFGLLLVVTFAVGLWWSLRRAPAAAIARTQVVDAAQVILAVSILGARLHYVAGHWADFRARPLTALAVWEGGLTYQGGAIAAALATWWWTRRRGISFLAMADVMAPAVALGEGISRIGCFLNGCCFGNPCSRPWAVTFPPGSFAANDLGGVPVHPTQLYQAAWGFAAAAALASLGLRRARGTVWWTLVLLLGVGRLAVDPFRHYEPGATIGAGSLRLPVSQVIAFSLAALAAGALIRLRRRAHGRRHD